MGGAESADALIPEPVGGVGLVTLNRPTQGRAGRS
jgi:hypothetical protein